MASDVSTRILEEMAEFSVGIIRACQMLTLPLSVIDQVTRSATSIGANFSEAQDASSKRDFINKIYISKKEASETKYWLTIITKLTGGSKEIRGFSLKNQQFIMILQKIINTSKQQHGKSSMVNLLPIANRQL